MTYLENVRALNNWKASITLDFEQRNKQTVLTGRQHQGPLLVQRPFYPEGPVCHVYLIHPPGGVVGGDELYMRSNCRENTEVLLTTPAAAKFYRSNQKMACQNVQLTVAEHSMLEWLPQESILFDRAEVKSTTRINLSKTARFIGWEMVTLGRPVCDEVFANGSAQINIEMFLENRPLLIERVELNAQTINSICGLAQHSMLATMLVYPACQDDLDFVRTRVGNIPFFGATLVNGVVVCRILGAQVEPIRKLFILIWRVLRPRLNQRQVCIPRIWAT